MVTIRLVRRALVPVDTEAAQRIATLSHDEAWGNLPDEALERQAAESLARLEASPLTRVTEDVLIVYEIVDPRREGVRQIGVGGMAVAGEIRTKERPLGGIVRNEGIAEGKVRGQARLIQRTGASIGMVNLAVEDLGGRLAVALLSSADRRPEDFRATDRRCCVHRVWLEDDPRTISSLTAALAREPMAYVADGNHRTASAAAFGPDEFLSVFFPARTMGLASHNRLVKGPRMALREILPALERCFHIRTLPKVYAFQPAVTHEIGLYCSHEWHRLTPLEGTFNPASAAETVDADIVQRRLFGEVLGIRDPQDGRLMFVGGDRSASYLRIRVDSGEFAYAVTLPPVTMEQFLRVCRQGQFMPPKSTWFQPKAFTGLVTAYAGAPSRVPLLRGSASSWGDGARYSNA